MKRLVLAVAVGSLLVWSLAAIPMKVVRGDDRRAPVRVLLLSGANNHDWEWTSPNLAELLSATGRFEVTITNDPAAALGDTAALADVDVFLLDYNGPRWGEPAESNFLRAVGNGTGVAVVHAANNAFEGWDGYEALVGLLWRQGTGHGRFHAFDVEMTDRGHPVTATLPNLVAHPDELYHRLVNTQGTDLRVLGRAHSSKESGGTGAEEPMVIVSSFGEGRVFHTPLGHVWRGDEASRVSQRDPQFAALLRRGVEWAATGSVTDTVLLETPSYPDTEQLTASGPARPLFDGRTLRGWRAVGQGGGWRVEGGAFQGVESPGDLALLSAETFGDFELRFEWQTSAGGRGALAYAVPNAQAERDAQPAYVLASSDGAASLAGPDSADATLGAAPSPALFHHARILRRDGRVEHWLDGERVLEASAPAGTGHFLLSVDAGEVWIRGLDVRALRSER